MEKLTLKLFGSPQISLNGQVLTQFISRKAQALLIYIAVTGKPYGREVLADLFWQNMPSSQALKNLRAVLPNLRQSVGSHLIITRQTIEFNRKCAYSLDVEAIEVIENYTKTGSWQSLAEAVAQYQGDFLEGFYVPDAPGFENWISIERERFRELAVEGLHRLAEQHLEQQDYTNGLAVTRKLLKLDPWRETAHQQQMFFLACTRQRQAALAQYELCRQMLADEFNAVPMATTLELHERIRAGDWFGSEAFRVNAGGLASETGTASRNLTVLDSSTSSDSSLAAAADSRFITRLPSSYCDWGEAADVSIFYGRELELANLQQYAIDQHCRLILLVGMGGIGKTALAAKLAHLIQPHFDYVIWRSLRNAPPLAALLADLVPFLSGQQDSQIEIKRLVHWLRCHRCLVILDNVETILQEGGRAGHDYRSGYEDYSELFKVIGEVQHQSCVVLTSREKLAEVAVLEGETSVQVLPLTGSATVAQFLLEMRGLRGSLAQKQQLAEKYSCNPLALKIVAGSIHDLFEGSIEEFLTQGVVLFTGIRRLLKQQFERLSPLERQIMYWLAINREWITIAELAIDMMAPVSRTRLLEALESLSWRSLIERRQGYYTQQPIMMEYVVDHLIETLVDEIVSKKLQWFDSIPLLKTNVKEYVLEAQRRLIVNGVAVRLQSIFETSVQIESQLHALLLMLRESHQSIYAAGNLLNLGCHLGLNLAGWDFSHLTIRYVDLQQKWLQSVNFQNSRFEQALFTQTVKFPFALAFSPDGTLLASGDGSGRIMMRRVADGELLLSWKGHCNTIWTLTWSPDGSTFATGSNDGTIRLWQASTGQCLQTMQASSVVWMVSWSADGSTLVSAGADDALQVWVASSGQKLETIDTQEHWAKAVVWSPDGEGVISGGRNGSIRVWQSRTGKAMQTWERHSQEIWCLALSPNGLLLASGSADHTICLWDARTGQSLHQLQGHSNTVLQLAWSADGRILASSSDDATIRLWEVSTGQCLRVLQGHQNSIWSLAWSPTEPLLASGSADHTTRMWHSRTGDCLTILQGYSACVRSLAWHPDGQTLAAGSDDHAIRLWNTTTGQCRQKLRGQSNCIWSLAWHPNRQTLASSSDNSMIELWNTQTGECWNSLKGHSNWIWSIAWSSDGRQLFSGSNDQSIRVWDGETGQCWKRFVSNGWVTAIAMSPDGSRLASGGIDCLVKLLHPGTGDCLQSLQGHTGWIWSLVWSPDGRQLATGSEDSTVRLWNVETGHCLHVLHTGSGRIFSVDWSPDGRYLACGGGDGVVQLWNAETGICEQRLEGTWGSLWAVAWQPTGQLLASAGDDDTIRLWNVQTGACIMILRADRPYEGMNISGATGLSVAQKTDLKALGANE